MTDNRPSRETIGERRTTHGHSINRQQSPTYTSWCAMVTRCTNPNFPGFQKWYGAKGVTICERWRTFENFLSDMGDRPVGTTLDRYPNRSGNYEPSNCRWATSSEQGRNRSTTRSVIRDDGLFFPSIIEAAEATGGNRRTIRDVCIGRHHTHRGHSWKFADGK